MSSPDWTISDETVWVNPDGVAKRWNGTEWVPYPSPPPPNQLVEMVDIAKKNLDVLVDIAKKLDTTNSLLEVLRVQLTVLEVDTMQIAKNTFH